MSLIKFVKSNNTNKAMECLQGSPNLMERDQSDGRTVFHYSIENNNIPLLSTLLSTLAEVHEFYDINIEDFYGHTPLILAINDNCIIGFDELLKYKLDVNYKTKNGRTALHYAVESHNTKFLEKLIEKKGNINANCSEGSCLHLALKSSQTENALLILDVAEASLLEIDGNGDSPLHTVIKEGIPDVFIRICQILEGLIKAEQIDLVEKILNQKNSLGNTIFHEAVLNKRSTLLKIMKDKYIDKDLLNRKIKNKAGKTGLELEILIKEEEENERMAVLERKKMSSVRNREKQEQKKKETLENEQRFKIEEEAKKKIQKNVEDKIEKQNKYGLGLTIAGLLLVFIVMYFALNYLEQKKRDNYID